MAKEAAAPVKVRVLVECEHGKPNDVIEIDVTWSNRWPAWSMPTLLPSNTPNRWRSKPSGGAMIHLHMSLATSNIRAYDQPDGYEKRLPYLALVTVTHLSDTFVYLHGAVGKVDRETRTKAFDLLRARGVTTVMIERRGKMRTIDL